MSTVPFITKRNRKYSLGNILQEVCDIYGVSIEMVKGRCRKKEYVKARRMYVFAATSMTNFGLKEIAKEIGVAEHTKIIYHRDKCKDYFKYEEPKFMQDYEQYASQSAIWKDYLSE